jgi:hypothetical protein
MPRVLLSEQADAWGGVLGLKAKKCNEDTAITIQTRSWSETEVAALRSIVKKGKDARTIGKNFTGLF